MIKLFHKIPLLRLLLFFVLGILGHDYFVGLSIGLLGPIVLGAIGGVALEMYNRNSRFFGILVPILFISLGYTYSLFFYSKFQWINSFQSNPKLFAVQLIESPVVKEKSVKVFAKIIQAYSYFHCGTGILYFEKDSLSMSLKPGHILVVRSEITPFSKPKNEYEFNIRDYRFKKGVLLTGFVPARDWKCIGKIETPFLDWRNALLMRISRIFKNQEYADVAHALVFGYEEAIDEEIKSAFQQSGIIHVLAVSGMHVSLIWLILSKVFFFLKKDFKQKLIKMILILILLWLYAAITGFSPSILRSTVMFSFLSWAKLRNKGKNTWNLLCASAFFMLLLSPSFVYDAGFWLSFLAVVGIMLYGPLLHIKLENYSRLKRSIYELLLITIIAQVFTMFYSVTMFGSFPNWFLLNNIFAVPLSSLTLIEGLIYLTLADIPYLGEILGMGFELLVKAMVVSAHYFQKLPYSYSSGIPFTTTQMFLSYISLGIITYAILKNKIKVLVYLPALILGIAGISFHHLNKRNDIQEIVFYSIKNATYVEYIENASVLELKSINMSDYSKEFSVSPFKRALFFKTKTYSIPKSDFIETKMGNMVFIEDYRMFKSIANEKIDLWNVCGKIRPPNQVFIPPKMIVLHGNVPKYLRSKWVEFAAENKVYLYDIEERGMLRLKL